MISHIIFLINIFEIIVAFNDIHCFFIDKDLIKDILDLVIIVKYSVYAFFKYISIRIHYYYLMIYTIFVLPHIPFVLFILKYFYVFKRTAIWYMRYFKFISKRRKWWKLYYKFHRINYFKVLFFILFFILFWLMWKRKQTYLKRSIIIRLIFFYFLSIYLSDIFVVLFDYSIIGYILALFISFFMIFITLN